MTKYLAFLSCIVLMGCATKGHQHPNTSLSGAVARQGVKVIELENKGVWTEEALRDLDKRVTDLETIQK